MSGASNAKGPLDEDAVSPPFIHIDKKRLRHVGTNKYLTVKDDKPIFRTLKSCEEDETDMVHSMVHACGEEDSPAYTPDDKRVQVYSFVAADGKYICSEKDKQPSIELRHLEVKVQCLSKLETEKDPMYFYANPTGDRIRFQSTLNRNHFMAVMNGVFQLKECCSPNGDDDDIHFQFEPADSTSS